MEPTQEGLGRVVRVCYVCEGSKRKARGCDRRGPPEGHSRRVFRLEPSGYPYSHHVTSCEQPYALFTKPSGTLWETDPAALQADDSLRALRFRLVPGRLSEEDFWRCYFWHVVRLHAAQPTFLPWFAAS